MSEGEKKKRGGKEKKVKRKREMAMCHLEGGWEKIE